MQTDIDLNDRMKKFGDDLAELVSKRDSDILMKELDRMQSFFDGTATRGSSKPMAGKGGYNKPAVPAEPAKSEELTALVEQFETDVQEILARRMGEVTQARLDQLKAQLLNPTPQAFFRPAKLASPRKAPGSGAPGERAASLPRPCPVPGCGAPPSTAKRYSYICDAHRSPENLEKYRAGGS